MKDESECPNTAINRLEKALERIAFVTSVSSPLQVKGAVKSNGLELRVHEAAKQLDALIDRLRIHILKPRFYSKPQASWDKGNRNGERGLRHPEQ